MVKERYTVFGSGTEAPFSVVLRSLFQNGFVSSKFVIGALNDLEIVEFLFSFFFYFF